MKEIGYYRQGDMCTFKPNQEEYRLLEELADKLTELSPNGFKYWVGDTYLDYGSGWKWTTVLAEDTKSPYFQSTYQAISPAEWLALMNGEDVTYIAENVLSDKYCPDKIKASRQLKHRRPVWSSRNVSSRKTISANYRINASTTLDKKYRGIWFGGGPITVREVLDKIANMNNGQGFYIKKTRKMTSENLLDAPSIEFWLCDEEGRGKLKLDQDCIDYLYDILGDGYLKDTISEIIS